LSAKVKIIFLIFLKLNIIIRIQLARGNQQGAFLTHSALAHANFLQGKFDYLEKHILTNCHEFLDMWYLQANSLQICYYFVTNQHETIPTAEKNALKFLGNFLKVFDLSPLEQSGHSSFWNIPSSILRSDKLLRILKIFKYAI
jgi:hypothetical protein